MAFPSKAKLRGFSKAKSTDPSKKHLDLLGGKRTKAPEFNIPGDRSFGETVISKARATAGMQGMEPQQPTKRQRTGTRKDSRKQFKPKGGAKVF